MRLMINSGSDARRQAPGSAATCGGSRCWAPATKQAGGAGKGRTSRGAGVTGSQISAAAVALTDVHPGTGGYSCHSPAGVACAPVGVFWGVTKPGAAQSGVSLLR